MSTQDLMDPKLPEWMTENTRKVRAREAEIRSKLGDDGWQEMLSLAQQKDSTRVSEWQKYHDKKAEFVSQNDNSADSHLRAVKEGLSVITDPSVRDKIEGDSKDTILAYDAYQNAKEAFTQTYGNVEQAIREYTADPQRFSGPLAGVLEDLSNFPRFLKSFTEGSRVEKLNQGTDAGDHAVRIAERHTDLGAGLRSLSLEPTRTGSLSQLGFRPDQVKKDTLNRIVKKFPELVKVVDSSEEVRNLFETYALSRSLYLQVAAQREDMATSMLESGQVGSFREGMDLVTRWLRDAHQSLLDVKEGLPDTTVFTPRDGEVEEEDPFMAPPSPALPSDGFAGFLKGVVRGGLDLYAPIARSLGKDDLSGIAGAIAPRSEQPGLGESKIGVIPLPNSQMVSEMVGETLGMLPAFLAAAPAAGAAGRAVGGGVRGAAAAGATELGGAELLTPAKELGDVGGRLQGASIGAAVGAGLGAGGKVALEGVKAVAGGARKAISGAARGIEKLGEAPKPKIERPLARIAKAESELAVKAKQPKVTPTKPSLDPVILPAPTRELAPAGTVPKTLGGAVFKGGSQPGKRPVVPAVKDPVNQGSLKDLNKALGSSLDPPKLPKVSTPPKGEINDTLVRDLQNAGETRKAVEQLAINAHRQKIKFVRQEAIKVDQIAATLPRKSRGKIADDITFFAEGTGNPKIPGDTPAKLVARLNSSKNAIDAASRYKDTTAEGRHVLNDFARKNLDSEEDFIGYVEDYVFHMWHVPKNLKKSVPEILRKWRADQVGKSGFGTPGPKVPSKHNRRIPTIEEGIKMGFMPKTTNAFDLHKMWAEVNWRPVTQREFLREIKKVKTPTGDPLFLPLGAKGASDYKIVNNNLLELGGARVHKDVADIVEFALNRPLSGNFGKTLDTINAYIKSANVGLSGFHGVALVESAAATMRQTFNPLRAFVQIGGRDPLTNRRTFLQAPLIRSRKVLKDAKALQIMDDAGLTLTRLEPDVGANIIARHMDFVDNWLDLKAANAKGVALLGKPFMKAGAAAARGFKGAVLLNNKILWDYIHNGYKAYAFMQHNTSALRHASQRAIKGKPLTNKAGRELTSKEVSQDVAAAMNDAFGGIEWETQFWASKKTQQYMRRLAFSLDWTTANARVAALPFSKSPVKRAIGRRYYRNMAISLAGAQAGLQYYFYHQFKGDELKGGNHTPFMWENGPGKRFDIDVTPMYHAKGQWEPGERRIYVSLGKQAREPFRWATEPVKEAFVKLSPLASIVGKNVLDASPGGYRTQFNGEPFWDTLPDRTAEAFKRLTPFSVEPTKEFPFVKQRTTQFAFSVPKKKGQSFTSLKNEMARTLKTYSDFRMWPLKNFPGLNASRWRALVNARDPRIVGAYEELVKDQIEVAELNGIDPQDVLKAAIRDVRTEHYREFYRIWKDTPRNKDGKIDSPSAIRDIEKISEAILLMDASLDFWEKGMKTRGIKISRDDEAQLREIIRTAQDALR